MKALETKTESLEKLKLLRDFERTEYKTLDEIIMHLQNLKNSGVSIVVDWRPRGKTYNTAQLIEDVKRLQKMTSSLFKDDQFSHKKYVSLVSEVPEVLNLRYKVDQILKVRWIQAGAKF